MLEIKETFKIKIDGNEVIAFPGETYLNAIQRAGIYVPTLCYEKELTPSGSCRLCVIEIEGSPKLVSSCTTPVQPGASIITSNERINKSREINIELILADHPLNCMVCEKNGKCTLQKLAYEYVPADKLKRFEGKSKTPRKIEQNEFFKLDYAMCIKCGKCVQVVEELQLCGVLSMQGRGFDIFPSPGFDRTFEEAGCVACGNCVAVCPVDAFVPNSLVHATREVNSQRTVSTCVYCGVGCQFEFVTDPVQNKIIYVDSHREAPVNGLAMCVKGRYGWDYVQHEDRLNYPLIRKNGELVRASWDEAYDLIESKMKAIYSEYGSDAFAFLSSAKCTNEENYLMQKLSRAAFKTNNVDHCARLCHASTVTGLVQTFGSGAMTNSIYDLTHDAEVVFIIGSNTTEAHPVIGIKLKQAVQKGLTKLIVADPRRIEISDYADVYLRHRPGTDLALMNAMMKVIYDAGLIDEQFISERTENFEEMKKLLDTVDLDEMAIITGVAVEDIRKAALLYGESGASAIVYAMGITQHFTGTYNVAGLANLAMMTGNVGRPGTGVNPLRGQNNVQGACDLGALPDVLPGYQKVNASGVVENFEQLWNTTGMSTTPGLTIVELMHQAAEGKIKSMFIMGENPAVSDPNVNKVRKALNSMDFLVVMDIFLSETAKYADVVLPAMSFAEKDGTFTNTERRVQRVRKTLQQIGERKADWEILNELLVRFGFPTRYTDPQEIMEEIQAVTPIYGGITYSRIDKEGLAWPCRTLDDPGTKILHTKKFSRGKGHFLPMKHIDPAEMPDDEYPMILTTGRNLYHFHTGEMTHRSQGLHDRRPIEQTEINPVDAKLYGIEHGKKMRLTSRRGTLITEANITDHVMRGVIFMTFHYKDSAANLLTNDVLDPMAKIPELKVAAIKVEPVNG